ncbi:MAG: hypothetical protein AAGF83_16895 [Cyanobacteria bacterium P01_G01_bin.67]
MLNTSDIFMQNSVAFFNRNQQPVLPCADLLSQTKIKQLAQLPIGIKIKSFKINAVDYSKTKVWRQQNIELPHFEDLQSYSLSQDSEKIDYDINNLVPLESQASLRTNRRFWWQWLLSSSKKISLLIVLILFQSSSQATNLLEKAKIYVDLNSHQAITLPTSSKTYLKDNQASPFNRAIEQAREIEVNSPFYPEARENIYRWSETIFDIAQGRADSGDLTGAIAAVELIPQNHPATKLVAQQGAKAVQDWQQTVQEQNLYQDFLFKAKTSIQPDSASSYNQAIGILQQIAPGAKEYPEAQELSNQWNEKIYLIAKTRAEQGNFQQAVTAAILISPHSSYHQLAKDEIESRIKSIYARYTE